MTLPFVIISSILLVELCYKTFVLFSNKIKLNINLMDLKDQNEIFYSKYDIAYVFKLMAKNKKGLAMIKDSSLRRFFRKYVYKWNDDFRFSSRFINTIVAATLTLFYYSVYFSQNLLIASLDLIPISFQILSNMTNVNESESEDALKIFKTFYDAKNQFIQSSLTTLFILSFFISLLICLAQLFLLVRECQNNLLDSYKGKCDLIKPNKKNQLSKGEIAKSSFKFGG